MKRRVLGERVVQGIRFPVMEQREFADIVLDSEILTPRETNRIVKYFNSVLNVPLGFLEARRAGGKHVVSRFRSPCRGWHYSSLCQNSIIFHVDKNIHLHAIHLFGSDNSEYLVTLEVFDNSRGLSVGMQRGNFLSQQIQCEKVDHQGFDIVFEPPIAIKANTQYQVRASISGSPSWYGINGCSTVKHSGVTFHLTTVLGFSSCCEKGQFPKFVFT